MNLGGALLAAALMISAPASAREWPETGGYDIGQGDGFCIMSEEFQGPGSSQLMLTLNPAGDPGLVVMNYNWSAKDGEEYKDISVALNGTVYEGGTATGVVATEGRKGFIIGVNPDFLPHFARSTYLHVYKGKQIIDRLDLGGSAAALAVLRQCVAVVAQEQKAAEREKKRYEDLPADPFAKKD